jgi:uncharacterized protein (TIGR03067 family)
LTKLQGTWVTEEADLLGYKQTGRSVSAIRWTFAGNTLTTNDGRYTFKSTVSVNPSANPKTLDMTTDMSSYSQQQKEILNKMGINGNSLGVYEVQGDWLKVCIGQGQRPASFSTKGVNFGC